MTQVGPLAKFNTIDDLEEVAVLDALRSAPLSGFIASKEDGGKYVSLLERIWMTKVKKKHAITFNSATSALLAASAAIGQHTTKHEVLVSPFTMSATVAAPKFYGFAIKFVDIEPETFGLDPRRVEQAFNPRKTRAIFTTNLFGHTSRINELRQFADANRLFLVEDASQSPMATENGTLSGTAGHIGVFSLNVHKHIQCGEGGIAVTDDDSLAFRMRCFRNHGENLENGMLGLNLRMAEPIAAIACVQTDKLEAILEDRIALAHALNKQMTGVKGARPPLVRQNCRHVYYAWSLLLNSYKRDEFIAKLGKSGVPLSAYSPPLYALKAFMYHYRDCPIAEDVFKRLVLFEICTYSPTELQVHQMGKLLRGALTV